MHQANRDFAQAQKKNEYETQSSDGQEQCSTRHATHVAFPHPTPQRDTRSAPGRILDDGSPLQNKRFSSPTFHIHLS